MRPGLQGAGTVAGSVEVAGRMQEPGGSPREEAALFRAEAVEERALEEGEMSRIQ